MVFLVSKRGKSRKDIGWIQNLIHGMEGIWLNPIVIILRVVHRDSNIWVSIDYIFINWVIQ